MGELPTGTVTLLFTDIEGSTRLLERLGSEYEGVLAEHRRLIREAVSAHGGVEVDTQGDAFLCVFARASDAVAAAAAAQRRLADRAVRVRMGIHTGEPTRTEEGYVGVDLHRGARVMAAGHGGQVLLSQPTRDLLGDVALRDLGEHRLKDLSEPHRLFQLLVDGLPTEFPPLRTLENRPTNLPAQPTPLVGREDELAEVIVLVRAHALVTLTGPGGTGKTRLALQAAAEVVEEFAQGVFFVNLAALVDTELVVPTIAQTLGLHERPEETILETLGTYLAEKQLLLVLDNFEQVADAAPALAELRGRAERLKLLVTSRGPLHLSGERDYAVPPLAAEEALALFAERAQAAKASFSLNGNRPVVAEICRRLDRLPLAIELAAARIRLMPEKALLARLDEKLKVLTGGARDLDPRQQTLRAAIDWSHDLLTPEEQTLFRRLAVFAGGRTLEAIEKICAPGGELDVFEAIASLLDESLLRQDETDEDEPRYVMLETIHEYARERLEESGEGDRFRLAHAEWFLAFARRANEGLRTPEQHVWIGRLRAEQDNLRAALAFARSSGEDELEVRLCVALATYWSLTTAVREATEALADARAKASAVDERARAVLFGWAGIAASWAGDYEQALADAEEAFAIFDGLGATRSAIETLWGITTAHERLGEIEEAVRFGNLAVERARQQGDAYVLANSLNNLAYTELLAGELAPADEHAAEAVDLCRQAGDNSGLAAALHTAGSVARALGRGEEARERFQDALRVGLDLGSAEAEDAALIGLAVVEARGGDAARAARLLGAAERLREDGGFVTVVPADVREGEEAALERLGAEAFEAAWQEGTSMTVDEFVS